MCSVCIRPCSAYSVNNVYIVSREGLRFLRQNGGFSRANDKVSSILPHRSLGGPIDIFPVTVTSVHAVADFTGKM